MKNQKSRRINRKQTKRNTIKRKTIKRKQNKKIVYNQKKMYGGKFNPKEKVKLKKTLKKFNFDKKHLEEVMNKLDWGSRHFSGNNLAQLTSQYEDLNKDEFLEWLNDDYLVMFDDDGTDNEKADDDDDDDDDL